MPIYEYQCGSCGYEFEEIRSSKDDDCEVICPSCGEKKAQKKMSLFGSGASRDGGSSCVSSSPFT